MNDKRCDLSTYQIAQVQNALPFLAMCLRSDRQKPQIIILAVLTSQHWLIHCYLIPMTRLRNIEQPLGSLRPSAALIC